MPIVLGAYHHVDLPTDRRSTLLSFWLDPWINCRQMIER
jgi:hypothetical protein